MKLIFPATVARALREAGMWRATLIITEEGLLVKPYVAEPVGQGNRSQAAIVLPESWK